MCHVGALVEELNEIKDRRTTHPRTQALFRHTNNESDHPHHQCVGDGVMLLVPGVHLSTEHPRGIDRGDSMLLKVKCNEKGDDGRQR